MQFSIYQESRREATLALSDPGLFLRRSITNAHHAISGRAAEGGLPEAPPQVDLSGAVRLRAGDTLMLCTDGLWSPLSSKIIGNAVLKNGIMQAVPELLDEAERRAGRERDNLSVIAVTRA